MPRMSLLFVHAAFSVALLPLSGASWAASSDAVLPPIPPHLVTSPVSEWSGHPPEAVRAAAAALHDACAAWPKQSRLATEPPSPPLDMEASQHVKTCEFALDPNAYTFGTMIEGGVFGAMAAGIAMITYTVAKFLLSKSLERMARALNALWERQRRRHQSWPE